MKVLIIKMSSMGDIVHTFPAITDAAQANPSIQFDWVVEEAFAEVPSWHPAVQHVIPVAWRRWRKNLFSRQTRKEFRQFLAMLRNQRYDMIIDAQGLLKSGLFALLAKGRRVGLDWHSAREPLTSCFYQRRMSVDKDQHAVRRLRELFSKALDYNYKHSVINYGVKTTLPIAKNPSLPDNYCLFIPNTSWETKHWPIEYWRELFAKTEANHISILLPSGYQHEIPQIQKIAQGFLHATILPATSLTELRDIIANATAVVSVDTGLAHIAAALGVPTIVLYGPTDPLTIGTIGDSQFHLQATFPCAPCNQQQCTFTGASVVKPACFAAITPDRVWKILSIICDAHE